MRIQDLIPVSTRKFLLKLHQQSVWPGALAAYKKLIESGQHPSKELIQKLVYGWGNQGFSAQINYIDTCIKSAVSTEGLIFECGSGLSTILIGIIAKKQGRKMVSFEHIDFWANRIQKELDQNNLNNNQIFVRQLKDYGNYAWYNTDGLEFDKIGLCICDAPPGDTKGGRRGFLYLFKDQLLPGAVVLVDDTIREDERNMITEWEQIKPMSVEFKGDFDPHAILTIQ